MEGRTFLPAFMAERMSEEDNSIRGALTNLILGCPLNSAGISFTLTRG